MILKSPVDKTTANSGRPAGRKLSTKRILVELLTGPGVSGRKTRLAGRP